MAAVVAVAIVAGVLISNKIYNDTHTDVPDVIGMSYAETVSCFEKTAPVWTIRYEGVDTITNMSPEELNSNYEVAEVDPAVGTSLSIVEADQIVTVRLKRTLQALTNDAVAGFQQYTESFRLSDSGFKDQTYVVDSTYGSEDDQRESWYMQQEEQDIVQTLADQSEYPIIWLVHDYMGNLVGTYVAFPDGSSNDIMESTINTMVDLQSDANIGFSKNYQNWQNYKDEWFSHIINDFGYGSVETSYSDGTLIIYLHELDNYYRINENEEELSDSEYDNTFRNWSKSLAFFFQIPVTINYYQNTRDVSGLRSTVTAEPVRYYGG